MAPTVLGLICCTCLASALDMRGRGTLSQGLKEDQHKMHGHGRKKPERRPKKHVAAAAKQAPDSNDCVSLDDGNAVALLGSPKVPTKLLATTEGGARKCPPPNLVMPIRVRNDLGRELARKNLTGIGVEVGTQKGIFTRSLLSGWRGARLFVQVDLWAQQENYHDFANVDDNAQEANRRQACGWAKSCEQKKFVGQVVQCRNFSTTCAKYFPDESLDFVYLDARHDRKGLLDDLRTYWPKVRPGGIIAGHDYVVQNEPGKGPSPARGGQNWTLNYDGTVDATGRVAKGAVDDFFFGTDESPEDLKRCPRQPVITYRESNGNTNTWVVGK